MPESYYRVTDCQLDYNSIQNPDARNSAMLYIFVICFAVFGVSLVDMASGWSKLKPITNFNQSDSVNFLSDALVVEYVKREPIKTRGKCNVIAHMMMILGGAVLFLLVGLMLNSPAYGGTNCNLPFTFQHILFILLTISCLGFANTCLFTFEPQIKNPPNSFCKTVRFYTDDLFQVNSEKMNRYQFYNWEISPIV